MTGEFIEQPTDVFRLGIMVGSQMHVVGPLAGVAGGVGIVQTRPGPAGS